MNHHKLVKTILLVLLIVSFSVYLGAWIVLNGIPPRVSGVDNVVLEDLTVDGASLFLQSNAEALLLLNEMEISDRGGFNFFVAQRLTDSAIEKLENARQKYQRIVDLGGKVPLEGSARVKLSGFDYNGLAVTEDLNREMMKRVGAYLSRGDLPGLYRKNMQNVDLILGVLYSIRNDLEQGKLPDIQVFWKVLRLYTDSILFGNYATLVFGQIA